MSANLKEVTDKNESGTPVMPGKYSVEMFMSVDGELTKIAGPQTFEAKVLYNSTLPAEDRAELVAFQKEFWEFNRAVEGVLNSTRDLKAKTDVLIYAIKQTPEAPNSLMNDALKIKNETDQIEFHFRQLDGLIVKKDSSGCHINFIHTQIQRLATMTFLVSPTCYRTNTSQ